MFSNLTDRYILLKYINHLRSSVSPYALTLLEEIIENDSDEEVRDAARDAILPVKEEIFYRFKDARSLKKTHAKKEFNKLESSAVGEHIEVLLSLASYENSHHQLLPAKKHFARAYALDPKIMNDVATIELAEELFENSDVESFIKQLNKNERTLKGKYPWYSYLFDLLLAGMWIAVILVLIMLYFDTWHHYPAHCHRVHDGIFRYNEQVPYVPGENTPNCIDWDGAIRDAFARIAPNVPRIVIAGVVLLILSCSAFRIYLYIYHLYKRRNVGNWLEEARANTIIAIEEELLKALSPRKKRA